MPQDKPVTLAAITGAHGVAGEVRVKLFGEGLSALSQHKVFNAEKDGRSVALTLTKIKSDNKGGAIARFSGVSNRSDAEKLRGTVLTVSRTSLPPLEEGEYYHADLIGLAAVTDKGDEVGHVSNILNFGAGDLVEITKEDGKDFLVPMHKSAVLEWDHTRLVIDADYA